MASKFSNILELSAVTGHRQLLDDDVESLADEDADYANELP
jgi:hypothetical protein